VPAFYYRRGKSKVYFLPAVAGTNPTSGEITAGTDLSPWVVAINGWNFTNQRIDVPVLSSSFVSQIGGPDSAADSSLDVAEEDSGSNPAMTVCAKGTAGFILLAPRGLGTGKQAEVWPVISTGVNRDWSTGNDHAKAGISFAVTSPPVQTATLP
jgi:hypothetical protein